MRKGISSTVIMSCHRDGPLLFFPFFNLPFFSFFCILSFLFFCVTFFYYFFPLLSYFLSLTPRPVFISFSFSFYFIFFFSYHQFLFLSFFFLYFSLFRLHFGKSFSSLIFIQLFCFIRPNFPPFFFYILTHRMLSSIFHYYFSFWIQNIALTINLENLSQKTQRNHSGLICLMIPHEKPEDHLQNRPGPL